MEEEIDLRPYIEAVLRNWMWIIGAAILAAVIALGVSSTMSPTYEAVALVAVAEPSQIVQFDPRIRTADENQPYKAFPELATSDELLSSLLDEVTEIAPNVTSLASLRGMLTAKAGSDQRLLHLSVRYGDPQVAADVANKWAALFVVKANEVFGSQGDEQLGYFEDQLLVANQELQQAEQNLIDFQAHNRSTIVNNELSALQRTQADQLARKLQITLLLQDAEGLQEQLQNASIDNDLSSADQLAAMLLQLRAFGGLPSADAVTPWQLQVNVDQVEAIGRQKQITLLSGLQEALSAQTEQIDTHLSGLEPQILEAQKEKQEVDAEGSRLSRDLTVAEETYTALAHKVEEEKITSQNIGSGVRMASKSAVPGAPVGRGKLFIIAVAVVLGIFLSILVIIVITWWRA